MALAWLLVGMAVIGLVLGVYMLITGRPLVRFGWLAQTSTTPGGRLLGYALVLDSLTGLFIAQVLSLLSQHIEPPRWSVLVFFPMMIAAAIQWLAFRIDRRPNSAVQ